MYSLNKKFFSNINELTCYWAGFIAADGCLRRNKRTLNFCLNIKDMPHLELFCKDIEYTGKPKEYNRTKTYGHGKVYNEARLQISSKEFCKYLIDNFNITPNKTFTYILPKLNDEMMRHFYRGLCDGDGSFCILKASNSLYFKLIGIERIISDFRDRLISFGLPRNNIAQQGNVHNLRYGCKSAKKVGEYLYMNSSRHLERKHLVWSKS